MTNPKQGDIYLVNLDPTVGTEMSKTRPGVIVSNNQANNASNRISVAPVTSSNILKYIHLKFILKQVMKQGLKRTLK
ncbi:MAG: type II toxin-antitoxin system PemK/MazF family toxin [Spirochaetes bacterium]|nr:type II toxin-antitoxin system PemK/MazF family toxin [Spirochaetota bacterium]